MKRKVMGILFVFTLLTNSVNADLLTDLVWAGTKAVGKSVINSAAKNTKNKKSTRSTNKKRQTTIKKRKKTVVYHCSAKALRASGWTESTSLAKAKKGAIRQCMIRRVSDKPCVIQKCYKK